MMAWEGTRRKKEEIQDGGGDAQETTLGGAGVSAPVMNESWFGKVVEEVDPLIFEDTFCVISKKFNRHYIYRYSCSKSLLLLGPLNPFRRFAIYVTTHRWFDFLMILTILCNCVTLAMITNIFESTTGERIIPSFEVSVGYIEYVFLGIYSVELVLKVLAKGLIFNRFSYLRNRWNMLDMIVVVSGYIQVVREWQDEDSGKEGNELEFIRTFRVLRVFRTIAILPGLKMMINALFNSVVGLLEVMALTFVCLVIFAVLAQEIFQGRLRQKCVVDKGGPMDPDRLMNQPIAEEDGAERDRVWTEWVNNWKNWKRRSFPSDEPVFCGNGSDKRPCGEGYTCIGNLGENPDDGWTSFDSFFSSMFSTFHLLTLDYWERIYDVLISTCGVWSLLFFLLVIFLGSYYLLNLMLAVVALSYETEFIVQQQGSVSAEDRLGANRGQSNFSFDDLVKINICKMTHCVKRTQSERERRAKRLNMNEDDDDDNDSSLPQAPHTGRVEDVFLSMLGVRVALRHESDKIAIGHGRLSDEKEGGRNSKDPDGQQPTNETGTADEDLKKHDPEVPVGRRHSDVELDLKRNSSSLHLRFTQSVIELEHRVWNWRKRYLKRFVTHRWFDTAIMICIVANTVVLAMEHHGESKMLEEIVGVLNHVFMGIFTLECFLKLIVLQREYFQSGWNIFDLFIVLANFLDVIVSEYLNDLRSSGLSVIRSMRLLRVFKLAQSWVTMKVLLNIIFSTFGALANLIVVLLMVIYIFAVMGMQVLGKHYTPSAFDALGNPLEFPQWHWKHFWYAFMMVFRVLCGEWTEALWDCLKTQQYYIENQLSHIDSPVKQFFPYFKCMITYQLILIIGNFIVLNLFLALLLSSFDAQEMNTQREKELEVKRKSQGLRNIIDILMRKGRNSEGITELAEDLVSLAASETTVYEEKLFLPGGRANLPATHDSGMKGAEKGAPSKEAGMSRKVSSHKSLHISLARRRFKRAVKRVILQIQRQIAIRAIARMENRHRHRKHIPITNTLLLGNPAVKDSEEDFKFDETPESSEYAEDVELAGDCLPRRIWESALCPFKSKATKRRRSAMIESRQLARIRSGCAAIVSHPTFEFLMLMIIIVSSIVLCFEDIHLEKKPELKEILCNLNYAFTAIFCVEMVLKLFAIGIWGYCTNFWTILDGVIVIISVLSLYFDIALGMCLTFSSERTETAANLGALNSLRTLRALRPLRAISRWHGMKIVVHALLHAIPAIFNVLLVCLLFWLIFSIMGVQFFKGQFYRCVDENGERVDRMTVPSMEVCCAKSSTHGYSWINTISNYDNVFEGYLSLLQVATFEGWIELMSYSVDATGVDRQPATDSQIGYYAFYVIFIVFGSFFSLRLFIGVIIDNFNVLKKKYEGNVLEILLTPSQRNYYIAMKHLGSQKPQPVIQRPKAKFFAFFYDIAVSRRMEVAVFIMIFLNMVLEYFGYYGLHQTTIHLLRGFNIFFTTLYSIEALIKIIGLGTFYFTVPWNLFDFTLVACSIVNTFSELSLFLSISPTLLRITRVVRVGRLLRLVKAAKGIRKLMFALVVSLPALFNIGTLLALITFIYAILGMTLFGQAPKKWSIDDVFNFETFLNSCLMLLRLMTAAGWNEVLDSLTVIKPVCGTYRHLECGLPNEPECPNRGVVVAYIVSYLILTYLIVINLYIAIILENYVDASNDEDVGIVENDLEMYYIRWALYDPNATHFINFEDLSDFLDCLDPPLKFRKPNAVAIAAFNLPIARGNKLHCLDILEGLVAHLLDEADDSIEFRKLKSQMEHRFRKQFPSRRYLEIVSNTRRWKVEQNAAIIIQRAWKAYSGRKSSVQIPVIDEAELKMAEDQNLQKADESSQIPHGGIGHMMNRIGNVSAQQHKQIEKVGQAVLNSMTNTTTAKMK